MLIQDRVSIPFKRESLSKDEVVYERLFIGKNVRFNSLQTGKPIQSHARAEDVVRLTDDPTSFNSLQTGKPIQR